MDKAFSYDCGGAVNLTLEFKQMRVDWYVTDLRLARQIRSLVEMNNDSLRLQIRNAIQNDPAAIWKENAHDSAATEIAVYDALVASAATLEKDLLAADHAQETELWNALGQYLKDEIARETTLALAEETAVNAALTSINTAEQNLLLPERHLINSNCKFTNSFDAFDDKCP